VGSNQQNRGATRNYVLIGRQKIKPVIQIESDETLQ